MSQTGYTINPLTGRRIKIGGDTFNRLTFTAYDYINGELVRRANIPPPEPREFFYNIETGRLIYACTRRYYEYIRAGWEIENDYYLIPPHRSIEYLTQVAQHARNITPNLQNPSNYDTMMAVHRERLANLNMTLCRECFLAIKLEEGEYCNDCRPH